MTNETASAVDPTETGSAARFAWFHRLPTGAKVFAILSAALLPLALIAIFATLQTTRIADQETRARLRVATVEASRTLGIRLGSDVAALRSAVDALEDEPGNALACARVTGIFAPQAAHSGFAISDLSGRLLCGGGQAQAAPLPDAASTLGAAFSRPGGLLLGVRSRGGSVRGGIAFPAATLGAIAEPSAFAEEYGAVLIGDGEQLVLRATSAVGAFARTESVREPIGLGDLAIELRVPSAEITSPLLVALLLPVLMWLAAAGIAWFVVDRLLIRPLRRLRTRVGAFEPGVDFVPDPAEQVPAQEIAALGGTFRDITRTVRLHEADLAEGLVRQTRLTKEVHHRVKNNLQVIASLINFHARSATHPEASAAYASIQRRVDALAVVHRYHYAEMEVNRGLELRSVIGELASNIRATASDHSERMTIALDIEPVFVNQDVAVAVAFLMTELIELAMQVDAATQVRLSLRDDGDSHATIRVSSPALIEGDRLRTLLDTRYGRVTTGLSRQLRAPLHHDPLTGSFEIQIAVQGRP